MSTTKTTCAYCGVGCGVLATPDGKGGAKIAGDPDHPANFGRLCSKGSALGETLDLSDRLLTPMMDGVAASWDKALDTVAARFAETIAEHGPDSVAFYVSGQLLTEDYYIANKLIKGFMGTANIDTNSRLCMASTVAGHKRAFGTDTVPGQYEDLEEADLVVLTGSNLAWCHPVLYQRLAAAKEARPHMKVVNIDPRRTATNDLADLHLPLAPGSDVALFNGLLTAIEKAGAIDAAYASAHVTGLDAALDAARTSDAGATELTPDLLQKFYDLWIGTEKVVTVFSQGVNQSSSGADKVNAILNCHLATGRIGRPGLGPFSVTGQPNAMGGREVGGLANMLACHMDIENPTHRMAVKDFWSAPQIPEHPGLKAVDMFDAVGAGKIKALWVIHTNPAASMPDADAVRDAIDGCDFVVVSDVTAQTDTARLADIILPASGWGEKDGTVTNSERCISRQRPFLDAPGQARADWDILADVGRRMGFGAAFDYSGPAEVFRELATLSGIAGSMGLDFDISALWDVSDHEYNELRPSYWPLTKTRKGGRFFADGGFYTADRKARMLALTPKPPAAKPTDAFPYRLNTGRIRDQWHTMTRTAKSARLSSHLAEPFLEVHPRDADKLGLVAADLAEVSSPHGTAILRVLVTDRVMPGQVFVPMHWTGEMSSAGRVNALVAPVVDPVSGQPESKASVAQIAPYRPTHYGFGMSRNEPVSTDRYWAKARTDLGWRIELGLDDSPEDWLEFARNMFGITSNEVPLTVSDPGRGLHRMAFFEQGQLAAALFIAPQPVPVARPYLVGQIGAEFEPGLLSGQPGADRPDPGATVCACFNVGINTIRNAIAEKALGSVDAIGAALQAGTNCGSCKPELRQILEDGAPRLAAE